MASILEEEFVPSSADPVARRSLGGWNPVLGEWIDEQSRWPTPGPKETRNALFWGLKRTLDFVLAVSGALLAAPLLLLAAVTIKLDSCGPVLYRQRRIGLRQDPFELLKLRSMYVDAATSQPEARWTQVGDPRITRVGRLLRRYRIDELPQLWNVLRGEMSFVGPRPEQVPIAARLTSIAPDYRLRHLVRPGITGWAQVHAGYCASDDASLKKLAYDLQYVREMCLSLDIKIFYRTVAVVLTGRGSR